MPAVTVEERPSGEPIATTASPTRSARDSPSEAGFISLASSQNSTARS